MDSCVAQYDARIYDLAYNFLKSFEKVDDEVLNLHLNQADNISADSLSDIFFRLIQSLQNANMKANVIGGSIGGIEKLKSIIKYETINNFKDEEELLTEIFDKLSPVSSKSIEEHLGGNKQTLWHKYAKSLLSAKQFLSQFLDYDDFKKWIEFFDKDDRTRPALPMILSHEIYGLGFALACDFLKELGYVNFGKPDVHIKDIFIELGLSQVNSDYFILKDIAKVARNTGKTPYHIDKLFWLIGSGNFYKSDVNIGRQKQNFIRVINNQQ
jgi:thermostable 8-oxoguanine DNA glycosylase